MSTSIQVLTQRPRVCRLLKFSLVGATGVVVDMAVLHFLAEGRGWSVSLSKVCSAESAMLSNFFLNEAWTFCAFPDCTGKNLLTRLLQFQAICGVGIVIAVAFLKLLCESFNFNLYVANSFAILLVTVWNFWMKAVLNWRSKGMKENANTTKNMWEELKY